MMAQTDSIRIQKLYNVTDLTPVFRACGEAQQFAKLEALENQDSRALHGLFRHMSVQRQVGLSLLLMVYADRRQRSLFSHYRWMAQNLLCSLFSARHWMPFVGFCAYQSIYDRIHITPMFWWPCCHGLSRLPNTAKERRATRSMKPYSSYQLQVVNRKTAIVAY